VTIESIEQAKRGAPSLVKSSQIALSHRGRLDDWIGQTRARAVTHELAGSVGTISVSLATHGLVRG
jgi:hypothetical protein